MSLYKDSTLAMLPTAYKDGKLYSVRPTDGSGDFTFSRGSNLAATRVDVNGLIEKGRENLLLQSNSFNTTWFFNGFPTLTGGQSGYDGSSDAWSLSGTGFQYASVRQTIAISGIVTLSVYAKAGTQNFLAMNTGVSSTSAWFDLANGTLGSRDSNVVDSTIESVGGGWYRCSMCIVGISEFRIYVTDANNNFGTATGNIYIQDSQLEQGLVATDYIETGTSAAQSGILEDMPRLDYSGSCPSLLLEPSRTNSMLHSEYISTYFFYTNASATNNATTSPEGVINAASVIPNATSGMHQIASSNISASGSFTLSAFVKAGELNKVAIRESNATGAYASFDLSTGTKIEDNVSGASFIEPFENGWYRIGVTYTHSGNIRLGINELDNSYTTGNPSSGATYWSSNGTDKLYVYGLQCELGATYETSYIPTYGSSVTRAKDSSETTGLGSSLGSTEGTIFLEVSALSNDLSERRFSLSNGTTGNVARVGFTNISNRILAVLYNGSNQCVLTYAGADITQTNKIAFTYAENDFALYVNGESRSTDTFGSTFTEGTLTEVHFNEGDGNGNESFGNFKQVVIFPTRLTNAELAALTTL